MLKYGLVMMCVVVCAAHAAPEKGRTELDALAELRTRYEKSISRAKQELDEKMTILGENYLKALKRLAGSATGADVAAAAKSEVDRFQEKRGVSSADLVEEPADLRQIQLPRTATKRPKITKKSVIPHGMKTAWGTLTSAAR